MARERTNRMSLTMPESTKRVLEKLAHESGDSVSGIMQLLIERGLTLEAIGRSGGEVTARLKDGRVVTLADSSGHYIGYRNLIE